MSNLLLIFLLLGTIYNLDNSIIRLIGVILWICIPFFILILLKGKSYKVSNNSFSLITKEILIVAISYLLFLMCWIYNSETLVIGLSGAEVEMVTPFLYIVHVVGIISTLILIDRNYINKSIIVRFYIILIIFLFLDVIIRYFESPSTFMNYNDRFNAKNVGVFVNTNVLGQSIAFMIIVLENMILKYKRIFQILLLLILITTMARSAIVSLIAVYLFSFLWKQKLLYKFIAIIIGVLNLFLIYHLFDYLNLSNDGSFLTKIEFIKSVLFLIEHSSIYDFLFGFGASFNVIVSKLNVGEYSPHLSILKAFLYYGIIGVIFFVVMLYRVYCINNKMLFPIITFLIFGLAGAPIYWPTLTVGLILLLLNDYYVRKSNVN